MNKSEGKSFDELLKELIHMYNKLRTNEKGANIEISGDVDFLLEHYESIKSSIDEDVFDEMGEPVKEMFEHLLNELRKELGDEVSQNIQDDSSKEDSVISDLKRVDDELKQQNLSVSQINALLDERSRLLLKKV